MRYGLMLCALLVGGCAVTPNQMAVFGLTSSGPLPGRNASVQRPTPDLDAKVHRHAKAYLACALNEGRAFALQPERPENIAITAAKLCGNKAKEFREAAASLNRETSFAYVKDVEQTVRESVVAYVVAIRADARAAQQGISTQVPARKGQDI
jgi:hypothetical protein